MRRLLTLAVPFLLTLSACSSTRSSSRYPDGRTIPTRSGDVIVMPDGRVYRDANRNGIPDTRERGRYDRNGDGRTTVCHKGRNTITVGNAAASAHLRHGDYVGTCSARDRRYERRDDRHEDHDAHGRRGKGSRGRGHHD